MCRRFSELVCAIAVQQSKEPKAFHVPLISVCTAPYRTFREYTKCAVCLQWSYSRFDFENELGAGVRYTSYLALNEVQLKR